MFVCMLHAFHLDSSRDPTRHTKWKQVLKNGNLGYIFRLQFCKPGFEMVKYPLTLYISNRYEKWYDAFGRYCFSALRAPGHLIENQRFVPWLSTLIQPASGGIKENIRREEGKGLTAWRIAYSFCLGDLANRVDSFRSKGFLEFRKIGAWFMHYALKGPHHFKIKTIRRVRKPEIRLTD